MFLRDYCTNICKEIYVIVLYIDMQGDINICKEIYFIVLYIGMQIDITHARRYILLHCIYVCKEM